MFIAGFSSEKSCNPDSRVLLPIVIREEPLVLNPVTNVGIDVHTIAKMKNMIANHHGLFFLSSNITWLLYNDLNANLSLVIYVSFSN